MANDSDTKTTRKLIEQPLNPGNLQGQPTTETYNSYTASLSLLLSLQFPLITFLHLL